MNFDLRQLKWLRQKIERNVVEEGYQYFLERRIKPLVVSVEKQYALFAVYGRKTYITEIKNFLEPSITSSCTCPYFETQYKLCKHIAAGIFYLEANIEKVYYKEQLFKEKLNKLKQREFEEDVDVDKKLQVVFTKIDLINEIAEGKLEERSFLVSSVLDKPVVSGVDDEVKDVIISKLYRLLNKIKSEKLEYNEDRLLVAVDGQIEANLLILLDFDNVELGIKEFKFDNGGYIVKYLLYGIEYEAEFIVEDKKVFVRHRKHGLFDVHYALLKLLAYIIQVNPLFFRELVNEKEVILKFYYKLYLPKEEAVEILSVVSKEPFKFDVQVKEEYLADYEQRYGKIIALSKLLDKILTYKSNEIQFNFNFNFSYDKDKILIKNKLFKGEEELGDYLANVYKSYVFDSLSELFISLEYGLKFDKLMKYKQYQILSLLFNLLTGERVQVNSREYIVGGVIYLQLNLKEIDGKIVLSFNIKNFSDKFLDSDGIFNFLDDKVYVFSTFVEQELFNLLKGNELVIPIEHRELFFKDVIQKLRDLGLSV